MKKKFHSKDSAWRGMPDEKEFNWITFSTNVDVDNWNWLRRMSKETMIGSANASILRV